MSHDPTSQVRASTVLGFYYINGDRRRGLFPRVLRDVFFASFCYRILSAYRSSSCPGQRCELYQQYLSLGEPLIYPSLAQNSDFAWCYCFASHSIRSHNHPAWSPHTYRRCATMAVSSCTFGASHAILLVCSIYHHSEFCNFKLVNKFFNLDFVSN